MILRPKDKAAKVGVKNDAGKLRFDLIPVAPLRAIADVYTRGAAKYSDRNWERGLAWGRVFAAMMRHAWAWWGGERLDPVDGQHHLASVAWCAMALIEFERTHPELDDRAPAPAPAPAHAPSPEGTVDDTAATKAIHEMAGGRDDHR